MAKRHRNVSGSRGILLIATVSISHARKLPRGYESTPREVTPTKASGANGGPDACADAGGPGARPLPLALGPYEPSASLGDARPCHRSHSGLPARTGN